MFSLVSELEKERDGSKEENVCMFQKEENICMFQMVYSCSLLAPIAYHQVTNFKTSVEKKIKRKKKKTSVES